MTVTFDGWPRKTKGHLFYATSSFVHRFVPIGEFKLELQSGNAQFGSKSTIFLAVWPRNFMDDPQNKRASLLCYFKFCASFRTHWWIQTWVRVRKRPIWVKFDDFYSHATLKFDGWPWKTIGHLFYATSCLVQHFVAIGGFKLELQSDNAQSGSNSTIFRAVWPRNLTDDLENNRAPLLCYFKLCAAFRSHWWIQTGLTVRRRPIWVKFDDFLAVWPWNLTDHLEKQ